MKTGEIRLDIQQKTESPQIKQEGVKQEEVGTMHEVKQNKELFERESEESAMNKGCLQKTLSAKINKKACVILSFVKKTDNRMSFLEKEVLMRYVDTYSR